MSTPAIWVLSATILLVVTLPWAVLYALYRNEDQVKQNRIGRATMRGLDRVGRIVDRIPWF